VSGGIQFNMAEFATLRKSPDMQKMLLAEAQKLATQANADHEATALTPIESDETPSYKADVSVSDSRARARVYTATPRAMAHENRSSSLLRIAAT
jgi:hypothetical protein